MGTLLANPEMTVLDVAFAPKWEMIGDLRRLVHRTLGHLKLDEDAASAAALAAHELLENAVKYGQGPVRFRVTVDERGQQLESLEVENDATPEDVVRLEGALSALRGASDPLAHYHALMVRALESPGTSGLGLARIGAEAGLALHCRVQNGRVTTFATPKGVS